MRSYHSCDCGMVRVCRVVFDFVAAICGLAEIDMGACGGAFGDEMAGVLGELDRDALGGAFRDEVGRCAWRGR